MTLSESAAGAVLPWNSIDAESALVNALPQQSIDICLMCQRSESHCDNCIEWRGKGPGRPRKEIDHDLLLEMLKLKRCNHEICTALGVSIRTVQRLKKTMN